MTVEVDYKALYEQSQSANASLQLQLLQLSQQLAHLQKMIFGSKHERFVAEDPAHPQLSLNLATEAVASASVTGTQQINYSRQTVRVETYPSGEVPISG